MDKADLDSRTDREGQLFSKESMVRKHGSQEAKGISSSVATDGDKAGTTQRR